METKMKAAIWFLALLAPIIALSRRLPSYTLVGPPNLTRNHLDNSQSASEFNQAHDLTENVTSQNLFATKTVKRDGPTKTFEECVTTGNCMLEMLNNGIGPPSFYTSIAQLTAWMKAPKDESGPKNLDTMLKAQSWNTADFMEWGFYYDQTWIPTTFWPSGYWEAGFTFWINTDAGVIIASRAYAPKEPLVPASRPTPTPRPITRWSDFTFVVYNEACHGDLTCLRRLTWLIRSDVRNPSAIAMAIKALPDFEDRYEHWPGTNFGMDTDVGKSLLGTPNGYGLGWLLANHIVEFGVKSVDSVAVFGNDGVELCFAFHVVDGDVDTPMVLDGEGN